MTFSTLSLLMPLLAFTFMGMTFVNSANVGVQPIATQLIVADSDGRCAELCGPPPPDQTDFMS
ncbi:hypothetical protein KSZ_04600 [Dictyobacter formicarum]|uniref:Uncharacterized protein n=1 Tax=Dictyobacter formicarum TaxID=2778368 RepID=A0ABQ3V901_9CHLR|nr:hypothetical protein KSZ_04600 [Dictyobacter formicarum]